MPRWLKIVFISIASLFGLIILLWLALGAYVHFNKKSILEDVTAQLNENLNGKLTIEDMDPTLIRGFPGVAISLENVLLRDSLWDMHKKDLLKAKHIYVSVNAWSVMKGAPKIRDVNIDDAVMYLFVDSTGYSNANIFKLKENPDTSSGKKKAQPRINHLTLTNVDFSLENLSKKKHFHFDVNDVEGVIYYNDSGWAAHADIDAQVKEFTFNTGNGSFIKNKRVKADLDMGFNKRTQVLTIPAQGVNVNGDDINFAAVFNLHDTAKNYKINLIVDAIKFKEARSMVSPNIQSKLRAIEFEDDINVTAQISGSLEKRGDPLVHVNWVVKDNVMTTPGGKITDCNMTGSFINAANPALGQNDRNSLISVPKLTGKWNDIAFTADSAQVLDLIDPLISARIISKFDLKKINQVAPTNMISISEGTGNVDVFYRGALKVDDPRPPYINGFVKIAGLKATYVPRNLVFHNSTINLNFNGADVYLRNSKVNCKSSVLYLEGSMLNFLNLYYADPAKIVLDLRAKSPSIDLEEFQSLLSKRKTVAKTTTAKGGKNLQKAVGQLHDILDKSNLHLSLAVDKVQFKKFVATAIKADVNMTESAINLSNVSVKNSGGDVLLNAHVDQSGPSNAVSLNAHINNVDVTKFFAAMDNFGQNAITDKNLRGQLTAAADVKTIISDAGKIAPGSMRGKVDFNLANGALVNFEPLEKISKFVFRKRNLDNITFSDLKNTIGLEGTKITIHPMFIESSALVLQVEGVYGLDNKGTDIRVDVPLRNPKKDEHIIDDDERRASNMKGIVIHLQAVNGDDGNVKIKLRSKGKEKETAETTEQPESDSTQSSSSSKKKSKGLRGLFGK